MFIIMATAFANADMTPESFLSNFWGSHHSFLTITSLDNLK